MSSDRPRATAPKVQERPRDSHIREGNLNDAQNTFVAELAQSCDCATTSMKLHFCDAVINTHPHVDSVKRQTCCRSARRERTHVRSIARPQFRNAVTV